MATSRQQFFRSAWNLAKWRGPLRCGLSSKFFDHLLVIIIIYWCTGTIYLTVLVTVNRYVAVCRPYAASNTNAVRKQARLHVALRRVYTSPSSPRSLFSSMSPDSLSTKSDPGTTECAPIGLGWTITSGTRYVALGRSWNKWRRGAVA